MDMKKLLFVVCALAGSVIAANAQERDTTSTSSSAVVTPETSADKDEDRVKIKTDELPEAVKQTLADQEYKGWLINAAYHDKKEERFEVELKNGVDTQVVKFSQEGQRLDD
jgi:hypothetical protein